MDADLAPNASRFEPLPADAAERWSNFLNWETPYFPSRIGLELEELRTDYCRVKLPWDAANSQPAGVLHGGATATMIDTVVVPAIGWKYDQGIGFSTIELHVQYMGAITGDAVAEGWVLRRGRSIVFTQAEVRIAGGRLVAVGTATYKVAAAKA